MSRTQSLGRTPAPTLAFRFAKLEAGSAFRRIARALGVRRPDPISLDELPVPDSDAARAATALVEKCEPAFLLHHSMRSYLFGAAVGRHLGRRFDAEVLYLASILHDIGLVAPYDMDGSFELNGARAADQFLQAQHYAPDRAERVVEAIALHSAVGIADREDTETALLHFGAGVDVIGYRAEDLGPETRAAIVDAWPRLDFKRAFTDVIRDQVARKPQCHIAGHMGLGFARKMALAPFSE